ncbi:MAG: T9SS type A sorting domain-containing protein [Bacteroidota bacterium]|nr:T9SS type A sorting domain-containing protein [Bacteroidota bacterium]MDP4229316.1 T9SS type A sorting domain-containing protein [Bacteroidota bacterium]MDP4236826.1 T9SS type A sorting domain-containing protein [Bacteroidota bacterium]
MRALRILLILGLCFCGSRSIAQWEQSGLVNKNIYSLYSDASGLYAGTSDGKLFHSEDRGNTWVESDSGLSLQYIKSIIKKGKYLFASGDGGVFVSVDTGKSWSASLAKKGLLVYSSIVAGDYVMLNSSDSLLRSRDYGKTWSTFATKQFPTTVSCFYADSVSMYVANFDGVFFSADTGTTWGVTGLGTNREIREFASTTTHLFAGADHHHGVYRSTDFGASWTSVNNGINFPYQTIGSLYGAGSNIFACEVGGTVFYSSNNGDSWEDITGGLPSASSVVFVADGAYLFAGTSANGVWRRPLQDLLSVGFDPPKEYPSQRINGIHPNPCTSQTSIQCCIPTSEPVTLKIFDQLGREIITLLDKSPASGIFRVEWSVRNVPSGLYYVRLQSGNSVAIKSIAVAR